MESELRGRVKNQQMPIIASFDSGPLRDRLKLLAQMEYYEDVENRLLSLESSYQKCSLERDRLQHELGLREEKLHQLNMLNSKQSEFETRNLSLSLQVQSLNEVILLKKQKLQNAQHEVENVYFENSRLKMTIQQLQEKIVYLQAELQYSKVFIKDKDHELGDLRHNLETALLNGARKSSFAEVDELKRTIEAQQMQLSQHAKGNEMLMLQLLDCSSKSIKWQELERLNNNYEAEISRLNEQLRDRAVQLISINRRCEHNAMRASNGQARAREVQEEADKSEKRHKKQCNQLKKSLQTANRQLRELHDQVARERLQKKQLQEQMSSRTREVERLQQEAGRARAKQREMNMLITEAREQMQTLTRENQVKQMKLKELELQTIELGESHARVLQFSEKLKTLSAEHQALRDEKDQLQDEVKGLNKRSAKTVKELNQVLGEDYAPLEKNFNLGKAWRQVVQKARQKVAELQELHGKTKELDIINSRLRAENNSQQQLVSQLSGEVEERVSEVRALNSQNRRLEQQLEIMAIEMEKRECISKEGKHQQDYFKEIIAKKQKQIQQQGLRLFQQQNQLKRQKTQMVYLETTYQRMKTELEEKNVKLQMMLNQRAQAYNNLDSERKETKLLLKRLEERDKNFREHERERMREEAELRMKTQEEQTLKQELKQARSVIRQQNEVLASINNDLGNTRLTLGESLAQIKKLKEALAEIELECKRLRQEKKDLQEKSKQATVSLKQQLSVMSQQFVSVSKQLQRSAKQLQKQQLQKNNLMARLMELANLSEGKMQEQQMREHVIERLQQALSNFENQKLQVQSRAAIEKTRYVQQLTQKQAELTKVQSLLQQSERKVSLLQQRVEALQEGASRRQRDHKGLQQSHKKALDQLLRSEREIAERNLKQLKLEEQLRVRQSQLNQLSKLVEHSEVRFKAAQLMEEELTRLRQFEKRHDWLFKQNISIQELIQQNERQRRQLAKADNTVSTLARQLANLGPASTRLIEYEKELELVNHTLTQVQYELVQTKKRESELAADLRMMAQTKLRQGQAAKRVTQLQESNEQLKRKLSQKGEALRQVIKESSRVLKSLQSKKNILIIDSQ